MIPFVSISQNLKTKPDTICLPSKAVKDAVTLIEQGQFAKKEVETLRSKMDVMDSQMKIKDSIISLFSVREEHLMKISANFDTYVSNSKKQIENLTTMNDLIVKQYKREKKHKWLVALAGILASSLGAAWNYYGW